jgi:hypothetical protein
MIMMIAESDKEEDCGEDEDRKRDIIGRLPFGG